MKQSAVKPGENVIRYEVLPFANVSTLVMVRRTFGKYAGNDTFHKDFGFIREYVMDWSEFVRFMIQINPGARFYIVLR